MHLFDIFVREDVKSATRLVELSKFSMSKNYYITNETVPSWLYLVSIWDYDLQLKQSHFQ